jgi:hypothetical protein
LPLLSCSLLISNAQSVGLCLTGRGRDWREESCLTGTEGRHHYFVRFKIFSTSLNRKDC